jgi:hypothetical protein
MSDTNPELGSETTETELTIDQAAYAWDDEPETATIEPEQEEEVSQSEPDDLSLAEGDDISDGQEGDAETPEPTLASDDMVVEVDGEKIAVKDLKNSRLLEADYTRKTQEIAQVRSGLQELGANFQSALEHVGRLLQSKIPPMPSPELAFTNQDIISK